MNRQSATAQKLPTCKRLLCRLCRSYYPHKLKIVVLSEYAGFLCHLIRGWQDIPLAACASSIFLRSSAYGVEAASC